MDLGKIESLLFLQSFAHSGFALSALTTARSDFSLFLPDSVAISSSILPRSIAHLGSAVPVLDFLRPGSLTLLQSLSYIASLLLVLSVARCDFSMSLLDSATLSFPVSAKSLGRFGSATLILDLANLEFSAPLRSHACAGSTLFVLDFFHSDLPSFARSYFRIAFFVSVCDFSHSDSQLLLRMFSKLDSAVLVFGLSRLGSISSMPVVDSVHLGLTTLLRSTTKIEFVLPVLRFTHFEPFLLLHSFGHLGSSLLMLKSLDIGSFVPLQGHARLNLVLSVAGASCCGLFLPVLDFTVVEPFTSLKSLC